MVKCPKCEKRIPMMLFFTMTKDAIKCPKDAIKCPNCLSHLKLNRIINFLTSFLSFFLVYNLVIEFLPKIDFIFQVIICVGGVGAGIIINFLMYYFFGKFEISSKD